VLAPVNLTTAAQYSSRALAGSGGANDTTMGPLLCRAWAAAYRDARDADANDLTRS